MRSPRALSSVAKRHVAHIDAIGVPFDGSERVGNQADAAIALRRAGLLSAFEGHDAAIEDVTLPAATSARGPRRV